MKPEAHLKFKLKFKYLTVVPYHALTIPTVTTLESIQHCRLKLFYSASHNNLTMTTNTS